MTFLAEELPMFSIKTFILENLLNLTNIRPWPLNNSSVAHRLRNPALEKMIALGKVCWILSRNEQKNCNLIRQIVRNNRITFGANMQKKRSGLQARIFQINPKAVLVLWANYKRGCGGQCQVIHVCLDIFWSIDKIVCTSFFNVGSFWSNK